MGIPSYFHFILKNHKSILIKKQHMDCDDLFVDANSLIYDCIHELKNVSSNQEVYQMVYDKILLLVNTIAPNRKTYVCFDGVPPLPKMIQQRQRRFKSHLTKEILKQETQSWNTNHITPGTDFMMGLDEYLTGQFSKHKQIQFSGSDEPNEGEHKICHLLRNNPSFYHHKNIMIYGLDADLIMLGLLLQVEGFSTYLYKETKHFQYISQINEKDHYYFRLDTLANEIHGLLHNDKKQLSLQQSIYDYIFMCFICGNDFMPHVPCIQIRNNGIQILIDAYRKTNQTLIHIPTKRILWSSFRPFIQTMVDNEDTYIKENLNWKIKSKQHIKGIQYEDKLNFLPCMDNEKEKYLLDNLQEYNSYILEISDVDEVCIHYLEILEWTWYYYIGQNKNNRIYYGFSYGPLFRDLIHYIPIFDSHTFLDIEEPQEELNVYSQLFFVLPYANHKEIIPKSVYDNCASQMYTQIPQLKNMNYCFDYFLCKYFWESHLHMDEINIDSINKMVNHYNQ